MRSKFFSTAIAALACLILALPAAAQDSRSATGGILQGICEALAAWLGSSDAELEIIANVGDSIDISPVLIPGGIQAPGQPTDADSSHGLNGEPNPKTPEIGPIIIPAG